MTRRDEQLKRALARFRDRNPSYNRDWMRRWRAVEANRSAEQLRARENKLYKSGFLYVRRNS